MKGLEIKRFTKLYPDARNRVLFLAKVAGPAGEKATERPGSVERAHRGVGDPTDE